ncbi:MAG: twin-arginine translocation signal domain-containing protein [Betaproteobacteria bacterium]|nr:twin-arginine translocation signal domain-containing protein [Betaproteobacteria bacterium]
MKGSQSKLSRRNFLLAVGAGGAAATAAVVAKGRPTPPKKNEAVSGSKGYHLTEHIRNYYRTAKI